MSEEIKMEEDTKSQEALKIKQMMAARLLAGGCEPDIVTSQLGICAKTLYRWRKLPEFRDYLDRAITDRTNWRVAKLLDDAFTSLSYSVSTDASDAVRLRGALNVFKMFRMENMREAWAHENAISTGPQLDIPELEPSDDTITEEPHAP